MLLHDGEDGFPDVGDLKLRRLPAQLPGRSQKYAEEVRVRTHRVALEAALPQIVPKSRGQINESLDGELLDWHIQETRDVACGAAKHSQGQVWRSHWNGGQKVCQRPQLPGRYTDGRRRIAQISVNLVANWRCRFIHICKSSLFEARSKPEVLRIKRAETRGPVRHSSLRRRRNLLPAI